MDFETRSKLIQRIISGYQFISYGDKKYIVHDPSLLETYVSSNYFEEVYDSLLLDDVPSVEFTQLLLSERQLWSMKQESELEKLIVLIKDLQKRLPDLEFRSNEKKQHLLTIEAAKRRIEKLSREKNNLIFNTAEYVAKIEKYKYILFLTTYTEDGNRVWIDFIDFQKEDDKIISFLVNKVFFDSNIDTIIIRELARSDPWRNLWVSATKISHLFTKSVTELTELQKDLVTWSMIYDSVFESMETPTEDVINNDVLLDAWFEQQHKKRQDQRGNKEGFITNNEKIRNGQEIGVFVDSPEDAQKVYNLNDRTSKEILERNLEKIDREKEVKEINLPGKRKELLMQANNLYRDKMNAMSQ